MPSQYRPSDSVIRKHLAHVRNTAHLPSWQRADSSIALLLGLRNADVDAELRHISPQIPDDHCGTLGPAAVIEALDDLTVRRMIRLMARSSNALSLVWARFEPTEVETLVRELMPPIRNLLFASLCDLAQRFGSTELLTTLQQLQKPSGWLEEVSFARAVGAHCARPILIESATPEWLPNVSPALIRDPLTGLLNRAAILQDPHRYRLPDWDQCTHLPTRGVVMVDVDRMKQILDIYGMTSGDRMLIALAEHMHKLVGDRVIRFGGDEMLILWDGGNLEGLAQAVVESIRTLEIETVESPSQIMRVTISAGVASGDNTLAVLRAAENALDQAKLRGRNQCVIA
jgi:diguanylate cyclase (GGDEF)-like protein